MELKKAIMFSEHHQNDEKAAKADMVMQCYICEQSAIGQCPVCKRFYCKDHEVHRGFPDGLFVGCSVCVEGPWKARIWIGKKADQPVTVYGESLAKLRAAVSDWLRKNKPPFFGNAPPGYEITRRINYAYLDGTETGMAEGWCYVHGGYSRPSKRLENFDSVITHFVRIAMIREKEPPNYREIEIRLPWPDKYAEWLLPSVDEINRLADELGGIITEAQDERLIQKFFEQNPGLLVQLVHYHHARWAFPQPRLGSEHIPDFMICGKDSSGYHWHLVELENPNYDVLTKRGNPSAKLRHAMRQIHDWRIWLRKNCQYAQNELGYLDLDAEFDATIVIGRRKDMSHKDRERYRELSRDRIEVMSYDRLLDRVVSIARRWREFHDELSLRR